MTSGTNAKGRNIVKQKLSEVLSSFFFFFCKTTIQA